ncbi:MAG: carbohydrate binding family 9 domain-containing protein [Bacteroidales bacterium]|nr:carbohydrate binding family 9 domain-containing protein [Candidatus Latescibacterota bacterium]
MRKIHLLLILLALSSPALADQSFVLKTARTITPPVIDGIIDEKVWENAPVARDFIQYEPKHGQPSGNITRAMVVYDSEHLYVAFYLSDTEPPTAQLTRRDADLFNDDAVILVLDTYNDRRTAYYFMTNALGTQTDGRIGDDGRTLDNTWDAPWRSAAHRTETGWMVEIAIPFTSLKYNAGESVTWGINFGRSERRDLEVSFWSGPLDNRFRISQAGTLVELNIPPPTRRHQIIPYGLSRFEEKQKGELDAGIDIRYALTPKTAAYLTVNPDFATIEADQEQINLSRFELFLPEKRQFFIEGNELFRQRIRTFYSRRIPDIRVGGKILGKQGPWTFAALSAISDPLDDQDEATYSVARVQRDILGSSNVSFMAADRALNGNNQGSASADATLFFTRTLGMTTQLVKSYGQGDGDTWAYFIRPSYDSPTGHFHVRYTHIGDQVAENINAIGYMRDDNRREIDSAIEKVRFSDGTLERTQYSSNYNIYWGQDGTLRSWQIDQSIEIDLHNRFGFEVEYTEEFKKFEKDFRNRQAGITAGYNTREFQSAEVGYEFGRNFDSDFHLWNVETGYKVTSSLSLKYEFQRLILDPDPESESTWINVLKANQFFTKDLFLRVFFQTNSSIDRTNLQAVFVYRYQPPFGSIQLAFQRGTAGFGQRSEQGNTIFLKFTHVF